MAGTPSLLQRRLLVVTGKGGVGKTTIAAALGLAAAERGLRTIVVELGDQRRLPGLFAGAAARADGHAGADDTAAGAEARMGTGTGAGEETALAENLWSVTIDLDRALLQWLQTLGGRVPGRVLASSGTFQYFAAAAPGARELVSMVKIWELTREDRWRRRAQRYDLVVLDAPATGHALGLLHSPHTFGAIARVGPIFGQAERVRELLEDPAQTGYLAVAQPTEMAVGETIDLQAGLHAQLGCELDCTVVNATLPSRFDGPEMARIAGMNGRGAIKRSAALAACAVHERARVQHNQIARLRRHGLSVHTVPFVFSAELDLESIRSIGRRLADRV
ncbi:MAG: ArsA family ATPase [Solirubrobacteraceae bacterium]